MIKLIACDLDGTLLNASHQIDASSAEVIKKLQAAGIIFMVATGRNYQSVIPMLEEFDIRCDCLLLNGALIIDDKGNTCREITMPMHAVKDCINVLESLDSAYHIYSDEGTLTTNEVRGVLEFKKHMIRNGLSAEEIDEMLETTSFAKYDREIQDIEAYYKEERVIYKIETFSESEEKIDLVRNKLSTIKDIEITNSIANNLEITCSKAQKGSSLLAFCQQIGISKEEVLTFGDSLNDLSMMQRFPHSIAVANAIPEIKNAATYITKSNVEFGVNSVCLELLEYMKKVK
ncbi:MAG: HAD family hydrolase, partial [Longicatena sp.]